MAVVSFFGLAPAGAAQSSVSRATPSGGESSRISVSPRSYAVSLFSKVPLPSGAIALATPIEPLSPVTGSLGSLHVVDVVRYYLLPSSFGLSSFAESHFPRSQWQGSGSSFDGGYHFSDSFSVMPLCLNRHAAACEVTYSGVILAGKKQELRVDVSVVWLAVHVGRLPTTGVVTVTGYDKISVMNPSSGPVRVTLNESESSKLRSAISQLRTSPGGMCVEDSTLYTISVATKAEGKVFWSAIADECPGALYVTGQGGRFALSGRSCPLEKLVATFFPAKEAQGTRSGLKVCQPSW
jgi:hypothetical protein